MNRFEQWMLRRILAKEVLQGPQHGANIENLYGCIRRAAEREFVEDSRPSLHGYLRERFDADLAESPLN